MGLRLHRIDGIGGSRPTQLVGRCCFPPDQLHPAKANFGKVRFDDVCLTKAKFGYIITELFNSKLVACVCYSTWLNLSAQTLKLA